VEGTGQLCALATLLLVKGLVVAVGYAAGWTVGTCGHFPLVLKNTERVASALWGCQFLLTLPITAHATSYCSRYQLLLTLPVTAHATSFCSRYQLLLTLKVTAHATCYCSLLLVKSHVPVRF